ncbi:MAG: glycosyl hydrolase family 18 protein [Patescibacteria group bacterium]|nr:glycosyl hydrolase family 18 protein [bacterium]MDZ4241160.1 glycosyl hydrolase family 18 protein [Patescibacteria group bacterium]
MKVLMRISFLSLFVLAIFLLAPFGASAAPIYAPFEVSGWIPYWRTATGTADVLPHLNQLIEVNPFVYTLKSDGTFLDNGSLDKEPWVSFIAEAKRQKVRIIPTIMTSNSELLHKILSNQKSRIALEDAITALVKENNFDGIDIDFEGKRAEDRDYFSTFLRGLYQRMGNKWVMCTIEARTPVADRYFGNTPPADASLYANDLKEINKYCDRVRVMAYDQQSIDLKLMAEAEAKGELYAPVADPAWVEKVITLMAKDISKKKIVIGVPTYGYEYNVTAYAGSFAYDLLWSFNPGYAIPIANSFGITPTRNAQGEIFFSYLPTTTPITAKPQFIQNSQNVAQAALTFANTTNVNQVFRMMTWGDASSVADKIALAKKLGVRGIAIFKLDGGQDPAIWNILPKR